MDRAYVESIQGPTMLIRKIVLYALVGAMLGFIGQLVFDFFSWQVAPNCTLFHYFANDQLAVYLINSFSSHHWIEAMALFYQGILLKWLGTRSDEIIRTILISSFLFITLAMGLNEWSKKEKTAGRTFFIGGSFPGKLMVISALVGAMAGLLGQFIYDFYTWEGRGKGWTMHFAFNDDLIVLGVFGVVLEDLGAAKAVCYQTMICFWLEKRADAVGYAVLGTTISALGLGLLANRFKRRKSRLAQVPSMESSGTEFSTTTSSQIEGESGKNKQSISTEIGSSPPPQLTVQSSDNDSVIIASRQTDEVPR